MTRTGGKAPGEPGWPSHDTDAAPHQDPRSLVRGVSAAVAVLLITVALLVAGSWSVQARALIGLLGCVAAVGAGAWAYRGRSRRVSSVTGLLLLLGMAAMVGAAALVFISFGVREILAGTVVFGTAGTSCAVEGEAGTFPAGARVYAVAHMQRAIEPGEEVTMVVILDGAASTRVSEVSPRAFDCLGAPLQPPEPGVYRVEVMVADEMLAVGSFRMTPPHE